MAELVIHLPDGQTVDLLVPDGAQRVPVHIRKCKHCPLWFQPKTKRQVFYNPKHQKDWNNQQRKSA